MTARWPRIGDKSGAITSQLSGREAHAPATLAALYAENILPETRIGHPIIASRFIKVARRVGHCWKWRIPGACANLPVGPWSLTCIPLLACTSSHRHRGEGSQPRG